MSDYVSLLLIFLWLLLFVFLCGGAIGYWHGSTEERKQWNDLIDAGIINKPRIKKVAK